VALGDNDFDGGVFGGVDPVEFNRGAQRVFDEFKEDMVEMRWNVGK